MPIGPKNDPMLGPLGCRIGANSHTGPIPYQISEADSAQEKWSAVDALIERLMLPDDDPLAAVAHCCERAGLPGITVSPAQGKLLHVLTRMCSARPVLDAGTLGVQAKCLACWRGQARRSHATPAGRWLMAGTRVEPTRQRSGSLPRLTMDGVPK